MILKSYVVLKVYQLAKLLYKLMVIGWSPGQSLQLFALIAFYQSYNDTKFFLSDYFNNSVFFMSDTKLEKFDLNHKLSS